MSNTSEIIRTSAKKYRALYDHKFIFLAYNGPGPYSCFFCGEMVLAPWLPNQEQRKRLRIHHENHNHDDNRPENLKAAHDGCHAKHHADHQWQTRPREISEETRNKYRQNMLKRWQDPKYRSEIGGLVSAGAKRAWDAMTPEQRHIRGQQRRGVRDTRDC